MRAVVIRKHKRIDRLRAVVELVDDRLPQVVFERSGGMFRARHANAARQATTGPADRLAAIEKIYSQLVTWPEGVRYARPGLSDHTSYLSGLGTRTDQKIGRDAIERLAVLKKDYERLKADADKLLGASQ